MHYLVAFYQGLNAALDNSYLQAYNNTLIEEYVYLVVGFLYVAMLHIWVCILAVALFALTAGQ